jgi:Arc/MetJ-type ribon-helix-helix transcriptional regulator
MIRTQIQLTEEQAEQLKREAAARRTSVAELVRVGIDRLLQDSGAASRRERMLRAARLFGAFRSGHADLSRQHDDHFADAVSSAR